jgi:integrase/recombinase XerD
MPTTLSTTLRHIYDKVPNPVNSKLIEDFQSHMQGNTTSERHQNNNLKAIIAFARFLGPDTTFYQVTTRNQVTKFLDTKIKSSADDPEKRWITTWNDYLVRIKHFFRWLHNFRIKSNMECEEDESLSPPSNDWKTQRFVNIKRKRPLRRT